ncbi:hypothetical protein EVG20_g1306 [Dentipellis fragilis]|uniref:F-box domain-containing protein n=1 Tax=Dentipellis fragilis TaxID=205917 RepID=A0A4Y9ZC22_9AGAM|nr:hypothetical protein EVG20_g1306 [Dentipellis fragilis]
MLLPPLNDDCCTIILSMLEAPDLAAMSRVSRVAPSYVRRWLARNINIAGSHGTHFVDHDIYHFISQYTLWPYIEVLRMTPRPEYKPSFSDYFARPENRSLVHDGMHLIAEVVEAAVNLRSFRMDALFGKFLERDPRLLISLQHRSLLWELQLNGLRRKDMDSLLANPISNLRCLRLEISEVVDVRDIFEVVCSSARTLEEISISYRPGPHGSLTTRIGNGNLVSTYPRLQRLLLHNITIDPHGLLRAFPNLQTLKMDMQHDEEAPVILPAFVPESYINGTFCNPLPELRSIDGHSTLLALPLHSNLQRLHIRQLTNSPEFFEELLRIMGCSPLISVSLCVRVRSPTEGSPLTHDTWPFTTSHVISTVANCIPLAQFLEFSFNWGRFRPGRASGFSAKSCLKWTLSSDSACSPLAALSNLRFVSFTVPTPSREYSETPPHMQDIADDLLCTLPTIKYLSMRSWGIYRRRVYFRRRKSSDGETSSSESVRGNPAIEITCNEAHAAYLKYSWEATDLKGWIINEE